MSISRVSLPIENSGDKQVIKQSLLNLGGCNTGSQSYQLDKLPSKLKVWLKYAGNFIRVIHAKA